MSIYIAGMIATLLLLMNVGRLSKGYMPSVRLENDYREVVVAILFSWIGFIVILYVVYVVYRKTNIYYIFNKLLNLKNKLKDIINNLLEYLTKYFN